MAKDIKSVITVKANKSIIAIEQRKKELLAEVDKLSTDKENASDLRFDTDTSLNSLCKTFGSIISSSVSPSKSRAVGCGIQSAVVDEASYIDVHLKNSDGTISHEDIPVHVQLLGAITNTVINGEKVRWNGDAITYRYVPLEPGQHSLHVKVFDEHIGGSPFDISVSMSLRMRCIPKLALQGTANKLGGVAIGPHGEIAVVDTGGAGYKTVHVYNSKLELMMSFGDWGSGKGQCYYPIGVTFDLEGNIIVADTSNHRVHKYDRQGNLIRTVGVKGSGFLQFNRPTGVGVNKSGHVYVCDRGNNRVQILTPDLNYYKQFGKPGDANENLVFPWDLAFDSRGDVYVVDAGHTCIKRFAPYGDFQKRIGPIIHGKDSLKSPQMICIDEYDYVFVTEYVRHEVVVFDTEGVYHTSFGRYGKAKGQFYQPRGIAKGRDGTIYVTDPGNNRLQIFH